MKNKENLKLKRRFLGKLDNFDSKEERNFEKAHLKAYLKGNDHFFAKILKDVVDPNNPAGPKIKRWVKDYIKVKQEYYTI